MIMDKCDISEVLARCLVNRGLKDIDEINAFLKPSLDKLHNPFLMKDMKEACDILQEKVRNGKRYA